ncbi:TMEM175 family protein [Pseudoxanthomonas sp.]|uniref:TMEM175 family protein n=1 Tax=Pseudoxanthomonas sp. TaxID=1871049 RepID=UPI002622B167|nr:TMEM175 family protein [Pseudoxanthomonas sp.]WDS36725.1 MAG: TMEM175 family protein [Pseudoxanthomonas sp.]
MKDLGELEGQAGERGLVDLFPHDRVVFFSDAVFAIAITLLAIELKLPDREMIEHLGANGASGEVTALFVSYFISFAVTGLFWVGHMQTWRHVRQVSGKLVWTNLLQLMFVALMPFATREYSVYFAGESPGRFAFYAFVLAGISFFSFVSRRIVVRQEQLAERLGQGPARWLVWRGLVPLVVFTATIPLAFVLPVWCGGFVFMTIFPCLALVKCRILRTSLPAA